MNSKQWAKVRLNQSAKTLTMTKQIFKSQTLGMESLGTSKTFAIMNQKGINKLVNEGWKVVDGITKVTNNITESIKQVNLTGNPETEEAIRKYYIQKKQRQGVQFIKGASTKESIPLWEQSTIDHSAYQKKLESDKAESMKASFNVDNDKYYKKRERD